MIDFLSGFVMISSSFSSIITCLKITSGSTGQKSKQSIGRLVTIRSQSFPATFNRRKTLNLYWSDRPGMSIWAHARPSSRADGQLPAADRFAMIKRLRSVIINPDTREMEVLP